jgi:hypothetical protein
MILLLGHSKLSLLETFQVFRNYNMPFYSLYFHIFHFRRFFDRMKVHGIYIFRRKWRLGFKKKFSNYFIITFLFVETKGHRKSCFFNS